MEDLDIKPVGPEEAEDLLAVARETFIDAFASRNRPEDMEIYLRDVLSMQQFAHQLTDPHRHFFLARIGQSIVGYLKLNTGSRQSDLRDPRSLEIERIYILSPFQGEGIGKQLMIFAELFARKRVISRIWLGVWEENIKAMEFYKKLGYRVFDSHVFMLGKDIQKDILMDLQL